MKSKLRPIFFVLIIALIAAITLTPQVRSGDYGGGKTTETTSTTVSSLVSAQVTTVPENIDALWPLLLMLGCLSLFQYRRRSTQRA